MWSKCYIGINFLSKPRNRFNLRHGLFVLLLIEFKLITLELFDLELPDFLDEVAQIPNSTKRIIPLIVPMKVPLSIIYNTIYIMSEIMIVIYSLVQLSY
jgi:hypothetical protein